MNDRVSQEERGGKLVQALTKRDYHSLACMPEKPKDMLGTYMSPRSNARDLRVGVDTGHHCLDTHADVIGKIVIDVVCNRAGDWCN